MYTAKLSAHIRRYHVAVAVGVCGMLGFRSFRRAQRYAAACCAAGIPMVARWIR